MEMIMMSIKKENVEMKTLNAEAYNVATDIKEKLETKFTNGEAFNIATDIKLEEIIPKELKSILPLSKVFNVSSSDSFDTIYAKVIGKLRDPNFVGYE